MAMVPNKTAIERAFELARTGLYFEIAEIKDQLMGEGYFTDSITGPTLRAQLKSLMKSGQKTRWNVSSHTSSAGTVAAAKVNCVKSAHASNSKTGS